MRRVVITGAGTVNPLAQDVAGTFAALREGRCAIGALEFRDVERLTVRIGAQIRGWSAEERFSRSEMAPSGPVQPVCLGGCAAGRCGVGAGFHRSGRDDRGDYRFGRGRAADDG